MADEKLTEPPTQAKIEERDTSRVWDKRVRPEGVVPKQAQAYVVAGLAVLILMAVMFSKNHAKPAQNEASPPSLTASTDLNQRKIQELEQDLSAEQRQSEQQLQARRASTPGTATNPANGGQPAGVTSAAPSQTSAEPPRDPVAEAEKALAFKARFASNLVSRDDEASRVADLKPDSTDAGVHATATDGEFGSPSPEKPQQTRVSGQKRPAEVNVNSAHGQPFALFEGTTIDTALVNRLEGEFAGPVKVMVTNPAYSQDRQHVLIPEGSFILGDAQKVSGFGRKRLAVAFHRLIMPDGYSVDLDQFRGLDKAGETGLKDKVNNHYVEIFGASIALGIIAGAAESTNGNVGYNQSGSEAYRAGIASSLSQSSANVLDKFINIPPTITIREGHRIKVYLSQDLLLPAYENHDMPGVM
jgi:type IV secretion system protein VirB10